MEWLDSMNKAVEYIEDNITEKLDIEKVAKIALSSPFHFQRMYHVITGVTIAEYVRRRRLTLAAQDIISGEKIINVAYTYGYETPGANLKAYPKLSFHISIKGDKDMNYKIVEKESFRVVGKQTRITMVDGENFEQVPEFWNNCMKDGSYNWICSKVGKLGVLGICKDFGKDEFNYMIGVEEIKDSIPKGYVSATIPAATWAIFESSGALPDAIQDLTRRIFTEWLPSTGYEHACAPELEIYPEGDIYSSDYKCEIWIPIKK
ncbi:AraC family transcriptional regulator [Clostridium botulinum]|nr:AraC family transcriptional regulator [Clostridium botulinum]